MITERAGRRIREDIKGGPGRHEGSGELSPREARRYRLASGGSSSGGCVCVFVGVFTF